ncbi:MAG: phage protease [Planctomycetota bacterium]
MNEKNNEPKGERELATLAGARLDADPVPTRVLLVPWGHVQSTNGDFVVDAESGGLVIEAFKAHGADLPIDYEHQTLGGRYTAPTGQAPAAGWIKRIEVQEGFGIFAEVLWTPPALEQLAARQYRYLSPVALVRKADRKLVGLHSVALTNKPAIVNMTPIVNRAGATDEVTTAEALAALRACLALPPESAEVEVLVAAGRRLEEVARESALREAHRRVTEAQRQGRLTEVQRGWALSLAQKDPVLFDEWLKSAPVVVPLGRTAPATDVPRSTPGRQTLADAARAEFRACPELAALTSEEAYVAAAVRDA